MSNINLIVEWSKLVDKEYGERVNNKMKINQLSCIARCIISTSCGGYRKHRECSGPPVNANEINILPHSTI
jgi:hypothetical protein